MHLVQIQGHFTYLGKWLLECVNLHLANRLVQVKRKITVLKV